MKTRTLLWCILACVAIVLASASVAGYFYWKSTTTHPVTEAQWLYIHTGDDPQLTLERLADAGIDTDAPEFAIASSKYSLGQALERHRAGAYHLTPDLSTDDIVRRIARHQQDPVRLTFIGTRMLHELAGHMADQLAADSLQLLQAMYSPELLAESGCDSATICSIFLPDTYEVYWDVAPDQLMRRMLTEYRRFWNDKRMAQASALNVTPLQACILCSIAEEETADRRERATVARLYWNRLQRNMLLQADPTVKYAVGDFALRRILNCHLRVQSAYNTYLNPGLPPGPIRIVEKATIDAFLQSQPHKYLYMCAREDFSGLHNFATTLRQHNANAQKYHKALRANNIQ